MKISLPNLKNKLANGWELLTSDNTVFKVLPTDNVDVKLHNDGEISVSVIDALSGCLTSKRGIKKITPIALRHPKNHSRCIAIDRVVVPKQAKKNKSKIKIIVGDRHSACNVILAMYVYYKAMKAKGADNVEIVSYKWEWVNGSPTEPFITLVGDTSDTEIICCGFHPSATQLSVLDKFVLIPHVWFPSVVEKKTGSIVTKLKTLGIYPELSLDDEKEKIYLLCTGGNYISDAPETIVAFLNRMLSIFAPETCAEILQNTKSGFGIRQAMDIFMESDTKDTLHTQSIKLHIFDKDKELKNCINKKHSVSVSDYIICNAVSEFKSTHVVIKAENNTYNEGNYRCVTYPASKTASILAPKTPIVVYTSDERVDVYSNSDKVTPALNKVLGTIISSVLKDKKIRHIEIRRCVIA